MAPDAMSSSECGEGVLAGGAGRALSAIASGNIRDAQRTASHRKRRGQRLSTKACSVAQPPPAKRIETRRR
jgi:hypothetical protein